MVTNRRSMTSQDEARARGHQQIIDLFNKLRVQLPMTSSGRIAMTTQRRELKDDRKSSSDFGLNQLSDNESKISNVKAKAVCFLQPPGGNDLHESLQRSKSVPTSPNYYNIVPNATLIGQTTSRDDPAIPRRNEAPRRSNSSGAHAHDDSDLRRIVISSRTNAAAHECCACAGDLRRQNSELRMLCEDLQLKLAIALDGMEGMRKSRNSS